MEGGDARGLDVCGGLGGCRGYMHYRYATIGAPHTHMQFVLHMRSTGYTRPLCTQGVDSPSPCAFAFPPPDPSCWMVRSS